MFNCVSCLLLYIDLALCRNRHLQCEPLHGQEQSESNVDNVCVNARRCVSEGVCSEGVSIYNGNLGSVCINCYDSELHMLYAMTLLCSNASSCIMLAIGHSVPRPEEDAVQL